MSSGSSRLFAETLVHGAGTNRGLLTVVPASAASILGASRWTHARFARDGSRYLFEEAGTNDPDARRLSVSSSTYLAIPRDVASAMGAADGGLLGWHVSCGPKGGWQVHVRASRYADARPGPRRIPGGSKIYRRIVARTILRRKPSESKFDTTVPPACHRLLGLGERGHVKCIKSAKYWIIEQTSRSDGGARRITNGNRTGGTVHHVLRLPQGAGKDMCPGKSSILGWYFATDGLGAWAVHVRAVDSA